MKASFKSVKACSGVVVTARRGVATDGSGQSSVSSSGLVPAEARAIQAAAIELRPNRVEHRVCFVVSFAGHREIAKAGASNPRIKLAAHCQNRVSKRLCLQSLRRPAPYEAIIAVHRRRLAHHARLLPIGRRRDDQPLNPLKAPGQAIGRMDQLARQPVEQFRMRRQARPESQNRSASAPALRQNDSPTAD